MIIEVQLADNITTPLGLQSVKIRKLGRVVLLAGRNGSGKTRFLNLIRDQAANLTNFKQRKSEANSSILTLRNQLQLSERRIAASPENKEQVTQLEGEIARIRNAIREYEEILGELDPIITEPLSGKIAVIDFVPRTVELQDWANCPKNEWMTRAGQAKSAGVKQLYASTIPLIQQIMDRWVNTSHPNLSFSEPEKQAALSEYKRLQEIIEKFLGVNIGWDKDGYSTLFNRPLAQAQLSDGQKVILQLCVAIFAQGGTISNHIIFMDEPENHLHPSAVVDLLDAIIEQSPNGQLWIATHSIPLLSHFDESSIWYVEDGKISHAGKKPERVLSGLLGDQNRILKLRDFTALPAELARNRFAFECLQPPTVVVTNSNDPQVNQLHDQLRTIWKNRECINILDFGAGKGRMIANLADFSDISTDTINYIAYDSFPDDRDTCLRNISSVYGDSESRYFNSIEELRNSRDDGYFDVVVMCNVLHEIEHRKWSSTFKEVQILLKPDGHLLLIEDCRIPIGELPNQNGFIVLNTLHLKKLFQINSDENHFVAHDARFDSKEEKGRLMAHLIPREYLANVSFETIRSAISELKETSLNEIKRVRTKESNYAVGLAHAFWVQQLANAALVLSEMG